MLLQLDISLSVLILNRQKVFPGTLRNQPGGLWGDSFYWNSLNQNIGVFGPKGARHDMKNNNLGNRGGAHKSWKSWSLKFNCTFEENVLLFKKGQLLDRPLLSNDPFIPWSLLNSCLFSNNHPKYLENWVFLSLYESEGASCRSTSYLTTFCCKQSNPDQSQRLNGRWTRTTACFCACLVACLLEKAYSRTTKAFSLHCSIAQGPIVIRFGHEDKGTWCGKTTEQPCLGGKFNPHVPTSN